ncbi:hypothetical protein [Flexibacterium corallicola]|uniref:hypothetical protein n=1 Tax=Flexibacterium corallicola TaxID=3037259 RepID=UPI00286EE178|nr:hypothetical protein [Pseudovibrio sp. M1P-2-3]
MVRSIRQRPDKEKLQLFCLELSKVRYDILSETFSRDEFVRPYNMSSVPSTQYPSEMDIIQFFLNTPSNLNSAGLEVVLDWYSADLKYCQSNRDVSGISYIKDHNNINRFDLVLIDGSEFTGPCDAAMVYGSKVIVLTGTESYRGMYAHRLLKEDTTYHWVAYDPSIHDGYSIFERKDFN